LNSSALQ